MKSNYEKAIDLGKIWMKNSVNVGHGYEHARTCLIHAKEISKEIPVDEKLLEIAIWWHDAYKARVKKENVIDIVMEGKRSRKILEKEIYQYLNPSEILEIGIAIESHNSLIKSLLKHSDITQILIESDQIEVMNKERSLEYYKKQKDILHITISKFLDFLNPLFLSYFAKSKYTRNILKLRKSKK